MEYQTILGFAAAKEMMEVTTTVEFEMCTSFAPSVLTQFFLQTGCAFCHPNNCVKVLKAEDNIIQEAQLSLTNRTTRLEVSQGHQTWYHSIC